MRNFLSFVDRIKSSSKPVLRQLFELSKNDVRSTTGSNLRNILVLTSLHNVDHLRPSMVDDISYKMIRHEDQWKVKLIKEIIDMKFGMMDLPDEFTMEELDDILNLACTQ